MHAFHHPFVTDGADVREPEVDLVDDLFHRGYNKVDQAVPRVGAFAHDVGFQGDEAGVGGRCGRLIAAALRRRRRAVARFEDVWEVGPDVRHYVDVDEGYTYHRS